MSHYVMNFSDCWADLRKGVKAARADYLRKLERLERYADSEKGQEDIAAAKADFEAALESARGAARPRFARAIEGMKGRIAAPDMQPPTAEQLATLQMLELRDEIEASEIEAAAKVMGNNDAALRTLRDVLQRKGKIMPTSVKTFEAQTRDAVDALQRAANNILQWDGRSSMEISSDVSAAYHDYKWGGGAPVPSNARAAQFVADIEARSFYKDTARAIVGNDVPMSVVDALE